MKKYQKAEMEMILMKGTDIITGSNDTPVIPDPDDDD